MPIVRCLRVAQKETPRREMELEGRTSSIRSFVDGKEEERKEKKVQLVGAPRFVKLVDCSPMQSRTPSPGPQGLCPGPQSISQTQGLRQSIPQTQPPSLFPRRQEADNFPISMVLRKDKVEERQPNYGNV